MSLSNHVTLSITRDSVGVSRAGFGTLAILSHNASFAARVKYYKKTSDISADGFATDSPEYLAAKAALDQSPRPERVAILRGDGAVPTLKYTVDVETVRNTHKYELTVDGEGFDKETVSFTSDADATNDEIVAGLVTALNAVASKNYTAAATGTAGSQVVEVTGDSAGNWFAVEVVDVSDLGSKMSHADPGLSAELDAIELAEPDWYGLVTAYNSEAYVLAAASWAESNGKLYLADVVDTDAVTTTSDGTKDTLDKLDAANRDRTAGIYHPRPYEFLAAAWAGRCLPEDPGSITWKFKQLSGPTATSLTTTHRTNLAAREANFYEKVAGLSIMSEGTTSDGDYIDVRRGLDWLRDDLTKSVFEALASADKIPFTDPGVAQIEAEVRGSLRRAVDQGVLAADPEPVVTVPDVADVSSANKTARTLPDVEFSATLSGAIHKVEVDGVVSV